MINVTLKERVKLTAADKATLKKEIKDMVMDLEFDPWGRDECDLVTAEVGREIQLSRYGLYMTLKGVASVYIEDDTWDCPGVTEISEPSIDEVEVEYAFPCEDGWQTGDFTEDEEQEVIDAIEKEAWEIIKGIERRLR